MFRYRSSTYKQSRLSGAVVILELIYFMTVRSVRQVHANAAVALVKSIMQAMFMIAIFYVLMTFMGLKSAAIRGDILLFMMTGIFPFLTHTKAVKAVVKADGPLSAMVQHAPMNTAIAILASSLNVLYLQTLTMILVLFLYYALVTPFVIIEPVPAFAMFLLAWFSGVAVGMLFLAIKPWFPTVANMGSMMYRRANMIASGKMLAANMIPNLLLPIFIWNPLFHTIDQMRGYTFINYVPRLTNWQYPIYLSFVLIAFGMMAEFFARRNFSMSTTARR